MIWLILRTLISGIIILYIQVLMMPTLAVLGNIPVLFLGWIVYQVWSKPLSILLPILFVLGVCFDLTMPHMLGLQTLVFVLLAIGVDEINKPLEKESFISMLITLGLVNIIYALAMFLVYGIQSGFGGKLWLSLLIMLPYNAIVSVIVCSIYVFLSRLKLDFNHG